MGSLNGGGGGTMAEDRGDSEFNLTLNMESTAASSTPRATGVLRAEGSSYALPMHDAGIARQTAPEEPLSHAGSRAESVAGSRAGSQVLSESERSTSTMEPIQVEFSKEWLARGREASGVLQYEPPDAEISPSADDDAASMPTIVPPPLEFKDNLVAEGDEGDTQSLPEVDADAPNVMEPPVKAKWRVRFTDDTALILHTSEEILSGEVGLGRPRQEIDMRRHTVFADVHPNSQLDQFLASANAGRKSRETSMLGSVRPVRSGFRFHRRGMNFIVEDSDDDSSSDDDDDSSEEEEEEGFVESLKLLLRLPKPIALVRRHTAG